MHQGLQFEFANKSPIYPKFHDGVTQASVDLHEVGEPHILFAHCFRLVTFQVCSANIPPHTSL